MRAAAARLGMSEHEAALKRLRTLLVAQNALTIAIEEATEAVLRAAEVEGTMAMVESQRTPFGEPMMSGMRPKAGLPRAAEQTLAQGSSAGSVHDRTTRAMMRRLGSSDIERYISEKWRTAATAADRERVRAMIDSSADSGALDVEGAERLRILTAA
jgi:hypothetical protein